MEMIVAIEECPISLPEIVEEGVSGLVVEESARGLEQGLDRLVADAALRDRLREGARAAAERRFDLRVQAEAVTRFYAKVLAASSTA